MNLASWATWGPRRDWWSSVSVTALPFPSPARENSQSPGN
uniref:Uncharacterized protein n=1 Tax=Anguilla anguilla TaxID=7936 RepID=A0A0E9SFG5_ANGAN